MYKKTPSVVNVHFDRIQNGAMLNQNGDQNRDQNTAFP